MTLEINFSPELAELDIRIAISAMEIKDIQLHQRDYDFSGIVQEVQAYVLSQYRIETIKDDPLIQAYRQFYWRFLGIDPTKTRPANEALIRRVLKRRPLPEISPVVDTYNWASVRSRIPMGAYDQDRITYPLTLQFSKDGDEFWPIGKPKANLNRDILIVSDQKGLILSQYPYRDSEMTKITNTSRSVVILACGAPGVLGKDLDFALAVTKSHLDWAAQKGILGFTAGEISHFSNLKV